MENELLVFNGIDGTTGQYLLRPLSTREISRIAQGDTLDREQIDDLRPKTDADYLGVRDGVDATDISSAGWGVVFANTNDKTPAEIREALTPLLQLRKRQANGLYKELVYHTEESKERFLARHGKGPGSADPSKVPYYLLLIGSPEDIPFRFQYLLSVDYAVGRVHFDTVDDYARYADSVVACEQGHYTRNRSCALFGVQNPSDRATNMSARHLVAPIGNKIAAANPDWTVNTLLKDECTKSRLTELLADGSRPALLFTASHGMGYPKGHPRQVVHQGALLCQDWPGPLLWNGEIPPEQFFSGDDLSGANVAGLITFHFACYGAGTPLLDDFAHKAFRERVDIAEGPFVANLPKQMLSHEKGSALAVVGHVERAWGYSFIWPGAGEDIQAFEDTFNRLLTGCPIGYAMECFANRYASIATELEDKRQEIFGEAPDPLELAGMWTANNDARSYVIAGDPFVRLNTDNAV